MICKCAGDNVRYKLRGFENDKNIAIFMIVATGKLMKIKLSELMGSEVMSDLNATEVKTIHKKFYSQQGAVTTYDFKDRHERSWIMYVALNMLLFTLYLFTNIAALKPIFLEWPGIVVTAGTFLYPLTFLVVDMLNEFYGLRLARRAIGFAFVSNGMIIVMLSATTSLPGLAGWALDGPYTQVIGSLSAVLIASLVSFLVSEYVNTYLLCKIKELTNSKYLFVRVFFSTFCAVIIDSVLFCFLAFYGVMAFDVLVDMLIVQILIKIIFAFVNVLPAYGARALFKRYVFSEGAK